MGEPAVILADEPTGALDSHTSREVLSLLQKIHEAGNTVVLITHDNSIAVQAQRSYEQAVKSKYPTADMSGTVSEVYVRNGDPCPTALSCAASWETPISIWISCFPT